jgi:acetyl-CoA C-acetyltransferase
MRRVFILSAARTPTGALDGNLKDYSEQKLAAVAMEAALSQSGVDASSLSEVIVGVAKQTSRPSNLARYAMLEARLPVGVPAYTVHRQSASGLQAMANAVWGIRSGMAEVVMAGGAESMTNIPMEIHDGRFSFGKKTRMVFDPISAQLSGAQPESVYGELSLDGVNEEIAGLFGISGEELEAYARASFERAARRGPAEYISQMKVKKGKRIDDVACDELYDAPSVTARPADGAAMLVLASEDSSEGRDPLAEILSVSVAAGDPRGAGYVGAGAVKRAMTRAGISPCDVSLIDICETTAAQTLATVKELGLKPSDERINALGGGLAFGTPWGAAGAVQLTDAAHRLGVGDIGMIITAAEGGQAMCAVIKGCEGGL